MRKFGIILLLGLMAISLFTSIAKADITSDLVLYYPMDEGTGTTIYDSTASAVDGSITGAQWTFGQFDDGLAFNGTTDKVILSGYTMASDVYTFSVWFKKTAYSGEHVIVSGVPYMFGFDDANFMNWVDTNGVKYSVSIGSLTTNIWYHLAWVVNFTSAVTKVYLDGNYKATSTATTANPVETTTKLGCYATSRYFDGTLDDFRLYERELTGIEISALKALNPLTVEVAVAGSVTEVGWITFITLLSLSLVCLLLSWKSNVPLINFVFGTVTLGIAAYYLGSNMIFSGWINILAILMGSICMLSGYRSYRGT